jgi:hypothetical protein
MSKDLVFVYDHFYPDYSAGGPVTSLANLARLLSEPSLPRSGNLSDPSLPRSGNLSEPSLPQRGNPPIHNIKIITSSVYYDSRKTFEGIPLNQWTSYNNYTVWYADSKSSINKALDSIGHNSIIYLNGIFSQTFFLHVLRRAKARNLDVVISPRGMLQEGALRGKALKKNVYLFLLKLFGSLKGARWHATDEQERNDIRKHFGRNLEVDVIPNVARLPLTNNVVIEKTPGTLKLVCFSLISRKKNVKFLIDLLTTSKLPGITLDIVGPIKDPGYWMECQASIKNTNGVVKYLGVRHPGQVSEMLSAYHLFILPTHGENFGHAIMESMSAFRPVMISEHTPWKDVEPFKGGFSLPLVTSKWEDKLKEARDWSQPDFDKACVGAMDYFRSKINMSGLRSMYLSLFRAQQ